MLVEFALSPAIFDDSLQPNAEEWSDQIRELASAMFPRTAACPVVVSNLYDGSWQHEAAQSVKAIANQNDRARCQSLLDKIDRTLVTRPSAADWPVDEDGWGRVAIASDAEAPIDRIVLTDVCHTRMWAEEPSLRALKEVTDAGFWHGIPLDGSPRFDIAYQVGLLRALTTHSQFLWLASPHIRGTNDDETDFAIALIRQAFGRPSTFSSVDIEIHVEAPERPTATDFTTRLKNAQRNVEHRLREALTPGQTVNVVMWTKLLDRALIGGTYSPLSDGTQATSPRWGIYLGHIARRAAPPAVPPTGWHILLPDALVQWHDQLCQNNRATIIAQFAVVG
jgi:hypothetical protein